MVPTVGPWLIAVFAVKLAAIGCGGSPAGPEPPTSTSTGPAVPTRDELRSFSGPYRLEVVAPLDCAGRLPVTSFGFDVTLTFDNLGNARASLPFQPGRDLDQVDGGNVQVRPEGFALNLSGAWLAGTSYTLTSPYGYARAGDFRIQAGKGSFTGAIPMFLSVVRAAPPAAAADYHVWDCTSLDFAVTLRPR